MRLCLLPILALIASLTLLSNAQADTADHNAFACSYDLDMAACDEMINKTDDHDPEIKAGFYAVRAHERLENGDLEGSAKDVAQVKRLFPQAVFLLPFVTLQNDLDGATQDLKISCSLEVDTVQKRIDSCSKLIDTKSGTAKQLSDYYAYRAKAHMDLGEFPDAQADVAQAIIINPTGFSATDAAIELDYATGNYEAALKKTQDALAHLPRPPMDFALLQGQLAYLLGYHSQAIRNLMTAIRADGRSPLPHYWVSLVRIEDHEDVDRDFHRMADDVGLRTFIGKIGQFRLGKMTPQALTDAANALPAQLRQKRLCSAYFNIGHQAWLAGDTAGAKQAFQNALQTNQYRQIDYQMSKVLLKKISQ